MADHLPNAEKRVVPHDRFLEALFHHACAMDWLAHQLAGLTEADASSWKQQALEHSLQASEQISLDELRDMVLSNLAALRAAMDTHQSNKKRQSL